MAVTQNNYTGNGSTVLYSFTFPYLDPSDIKIEVNGTLTTAYTLANATTIQFNTAPANGATIRIYRDTDIEQLSATFFPGSAIRANDLNDDFNQALYKAQELESLVEPLASLQGTYYGAYAANPTLDPFGNPIEAGNLYFNTTVNQMYVYNGSTWQPASADTTVTRFKYIAAGGETSLSGADSNSNILAYNVGLEMVYLNGAFLTRGVDYTATNGSSITGLVALTAGDVAEIVVFSQIDAIGSIPGASIVDGTITTSKLTNDSVTTSKLANDSVTTSKLAFDGGALSGSRNRIINGDMRIDQRNAGASLTSTGDNYCLDRWMAQSAGGATSKYSVQQVADAPDGFTNSLRVTSLSAYSVTTNDAADINQRIEGFNIADLAWGTASAKSITVSFWVKSSLTGTFGGSIRGAGYTRAYPFSYAINSANTWESKTVAISGDTSGTWAKDNTAGLQLAFGLGNGSAYTGAAGSWATSNALQPTGSTSVIATNAATWHVTGVQLEAGTVATPFERRSYGQELSLCQRYFETITLQGNNNGALIFSCQSSTLATGMVGFNVQKRSTPVYTIGAGGFSIQAGGSVPQGVTVVSARGPVTKGGVAITFNAGTAGAGSVVHQAATTANGPLTADSEL